MSGGVTGVGRGAFGECLGQQVAAILSVDDRQYGGVEQVGMQVLRRLRHWVLMCQTRVHQCTNLFRALPQVYNPLVEPCSLQRTRCHLRDRPLGIDRTTCWTAKGMEAVLALRADIRVTRVRRSSDLG